MPFVGCCALVYFWTLRFSRIGDFYTLRLGFFGNLDLRIILLAKMNIHGRIRIHRMTHQLHIDLQNAIDNLMRYYTEMNWI